MRLGGEYRARLFASGMGSGLPNPRDELDLDRDIERQLGHSNRRTGVSSGFAKELHEQVREGALA